MNHPTLTPNKALLPTLRKLRQTYPDNPSNFLCICLSEMANAKQITKEECQKATNFLETSLTPEYSYMAWLSQNNRELYSTAYGQDTMRRGLRIEWLDFMLAPTLKDHDALADTTPA